MATTINKDRKDKDQTVLQKIDMFAPSVDLQHKGEKSQRTMTGGFLSIFTVSLFIVLMSVKVVDHLVLETPSFAQMKRMLAFNGVAPQSDAKANPSAYNYYNDANFKFNNVEKTMIDPGKFYKPLNMKSYFVEELNIVLNNDYNYDHINIGELAAFVTEDKPQQISKNVDNQKLFKDRIQDAYSKIGKYFQFELVTTYIEGQGRKGNYTVPDFQQKKIYTIKDFTLDSTDIIYKLNIASDVAVVGDFNNMNLTQMKQYVDFNINLNWMEIQKEAQKNAHAYFAVTITHNSPKGAISKTGKCYADYDSEFNNYKTYTDERKAGLLQLFQLDNNYITDPSGGFVKATASFVNEINKTIGAEAEYDEEKFSDADQEFYSRLKIDLNTCYTIEWSSQIEKVLQTNAAGTPTNSKGSIYSTGTTLITSSEYVYNDVFVPSNGTNAVSFNEIYRAEIRSVALKIFDQQQRVNRLFDSILVEYKALGSEKMQLISLNNVNYDCFWQAIQGNVTQGAQKQEQSAKCVKDVNIAEFMLIQQQAQDVFLYTHKEAAVQKPVQLYNRLEYLENKKITYSEYLSLPFPGTPKQVAFNNLWTTRFTMNQNGYLSTEIWFVQDQEVPRTTTNSAKNKRLLQEQQATQKFDLEIVGEQSVFSGLRMKAVTSTDVLELVAYAAGLWIFLSFSMGLMVQKVSQKDQIENVEAPVQGYDKVNETETEESLEQALDDILTEEQKEFIKSQQ